MCEVSFPLPPQARLRTSTTFDSLWVNLAHFGSLAANSPTRPMVGRAATGQALSWLYSGDLCPATISAQLAGVSDNPPRPASLSSAAQPAAATWCGGIVRLGGRQHGAEDQYKRRHRLLHSRRRPLRWLVDFTSRVDDGEHSVVTEDDALAWRHFQLGEAG